MQDPESELYGALPHLREDNVTEFDRIHELFQIYLLWISCQNKKLTFLLGRIPIFQSNQSNNALYEIYCIRE